MTISVRTRRDVVVVDPERFMAAARAAFRELHPDNDDEDAHLADLYDVVGTMLDRFGKLAGDAAEPPRPGQRVVDRDDGLSPAGEVHRIVLDERMPLSDYGCWMPDDQLP
ncbi:hypothetical protein HerbRD11066_73340 [Herbidospora sp. RD11066]